jgi:hypothetical protein
MVLNKIFTGFADQINDNLLLIMKFGSIVN